MYNNKYKAFKVNAHICWEVIKGVIPLTKTKNMI